MPEGDRGTLIGMIAPARLRPFLQVGAARRPVVRPGGTRRSAMAVATLVGLTACGAARSAGRSLADGAVDAVAVRESTLVAMGRRMTDSAGELLRREFRHAVIDPARATWDAMAVQVRQEVDSASARLAANVRESLAGATAELLERAFDVIETRTDRLAVSVPEAASPALERGLARSFGVVGDTLAHHLSVGLAAGLGEQLQPALHALMRDLSDSLRVRVGELDRTVAESSTVSGTRNIVLGSAATLALVALALAGLSWLRHRRALDAMIDAVHLADDARLHDAVRGCASDAGVDGWLESRIAARRGPGRPR